MVDRLVLRPEEETAKVVRAIEAAKAHRRKADESAEDSVSAVPFVSARNKDEIDAEFELERIKLEDGIHAHENVKLKLRDYAELTGRPLVHPFMLVVAQDTTHAEAIRRTIEAQGFFGGRYQGA